MREVEIERFRVRAEDGEEFTIIVYQEFIPAGTLDDPAAEIPGMQRLITTGGLLVTNDNAETFKVVVRNKVVRKI
jgi:hypothetical protein